MKLWLNEQQAREIARHALAEQPAEICGLIAGNDGKAEQIIPIPNVAVDTTHRFEMEANSLVRAMFAIEKQGLALIGIYHSHPNDEPIPSQTDIRESRYPDVCQVIVGLAGDEPAFAAWQIKNDEVNRVSLHVGPTPLQTDSGSLSTEQKTAIILSMVVAVVFMLVLSLSLLPPAPHIP